MSSFSANDSAPPTDTQIPTEMEGLLPAPLLRSLRRFAAPEDSEDAAPYSALTGGALLGTQKSSADGVLKQVAVWGCSACPRTTPRMASPSTGTCLGASVASVASLWCAGRRRNPPKSSVRAVLFPTSLSWC